MIKVQGHADDVDSFCACLSAAAEQFGLRGDYSTIAGLSGACFSPCHNRSETCIGWMMDGGSPARAEFIAWALGLRLERVELPPGAPDGWLEEYTRSGTLPPQGKEYFNSLRQAQEGGQMVLLPTWPGWSLLTGWADDLTRLPFATVRGFERAVANLRPPLKTGYAWTLQPLGLHQQPLGQHQHPCGTQWQLSEALGEALAYASGIATGAIVPESAGSGEQAVFGGELYGVILERVDQEMLCPGCSENGCFARVARRLHDGHAAALAFVQAARSLLENPKAQRLAPVEAGYAALSEISLYWAGLAQNPDIFDQTGLRPRIGEDFRRMQRIHTETAASLAGFKRG